MTENYYKTYLTTKEVANLLDVNEKIVYQLINEKGLPATKVTGKWLFSRQLVERWLEKHIINHPGSGGGFERNVLIIIGSNDLLLEKALSLFNRNCGEFVVVFGSVGSFLGIKALKEGKCDVATAHLLESHEEDYNFSYLRELLGEPIPAVVNFCFRKQGVLVAPGNPKHIKSIADLVRDDVLFVNRARGTGTRLLLEHEMQKLGISPEKIKGYENEMGTHLEVGIEILAGRADAGLGIEAVAQILGLDFIPIKKERYDLLIPKEMFFQKKVQQFLSFLQQDVFKQLGNQLAGYDISQSGQLIFPGSSISNSDD